MGLASGCENTFIERLKSLGVYGEKEIATSLLKRLTYGL